MKKFAVTILIACAFTSGLFSFSNRNESVFASENTQTQTSAVQSAQLIAPSSYEQYLPLSEPTDVAVSEDYIAISDRETVYVYDKTDTIYRVYTHERSVTELQFSNDGKLYFLDSATYLNTLNPKTLTQTKIDLVCSTFLINGKDVYYTNMSGTTSQISKYDTKNGETQLLKKGLTYPPLLSFFNDELYYTTWTGVKAQLQKLHPETKGEAEIASFEQELTALSITNNVLYCTFKNGTFCSYDLLKLIEEKDATATQTLFQASGGYSALSVFDESAFVIKEKSVREFSVLENAFTDYEIASASASASRLNGATDIALTQTQALFADNGNERISVYDLKNNIFQAPISTDIQADYICSDGNTVLVANETEAVLYTLSATAYGTQLTRYATFEGSVKGACSVYGKYYLVTDKNQFITLSQTPTEWTFQTVQKSSTKSPSMLASDVYGNLYTVCNDKVYQYSEESFSSIAVSSVEICSSLPNTTKEISFDYRGDLYALSETTLYRYKKQQSVYTQSNAYSLKETQVCGIEASPLSFALSMEENAVFLLDAHNYVTKRTDIHLPTVKTIPIGNEAEDILNATNQTFEVVTVDKNTLMVEFDLNKLSGESYYPYRSFKRANETLTAIKLGQSDVYDILAIYDESKNRHTTYLVYSASCKTLPVSEYEKTYTAEEQQTAYISNAVWLYSVPHVTEQLTICRISRGAEITLLGEINGLEIDYYYISYVDEAGETKTGYIPTNYVTPMRGETDTQTPSKGEETSKTDNVWRMMYILLGFGIILLLTDYLILRNDKS